jgi:hypothetical protein
MSKWEGAERHLDVTEFFGLCEAMGISASDVFKAIEQRVPLHGSALFREPMNRPPLVKAEP